MPKLELDIFAGLQVRAEAHLAFAVEEYSVLSYSTAKG